MWHQNNKPTFQVMENGLPKPKRVWKNSWKNTLTNLQVESDQAELPTGLLAGDDTPAVDGEVPVAQFITHTEVVVCPDVVP